MATPDLSLTRTPVRTIRRRRRPQTPAQWIILILAILIAIV